LQNATVFKNAFLLDSLTIRKISFIFKPIMARLLPVLAYN
jgi:hypothetical protein